jgi:hypothetical protein
MTESKSQYAVVLGISIFFGFFILGYLLSNAIIKFKEFERTVTAKGLSEREVEADIVIWPIKFTIAGNELTEIYNSIEANIEEIRDFLTTNGISLNEISYSIPSIVDKIAQQYGSTSRSELRYTASQTVTVYSKNISTVRKLMSRLLTLGKKGIVFSSDDYQSQTEYIYTRLNEIKPEMIEEATNNAREVANKFAADSQSRLGKIKKASQGQFSINDRDKNNPHIKKVRVVSTVEYYLVD